MWAIIDTSVYIGHWERGLYEQALADVGRTFIVRQSAVVLSELRRGARTRAAEKTVAGLHDRARDIWEPAAADWWEAGRLIRSIGDKHDWDRNKRRDFQNDVLIALTARRHGATVVTANREDFTLLGERLRVALFLL